MYPCHIICNSLNILLCPLSIMYYTIHWIVCVLWLVVAHDLLAYRHGWCHRKIVFLVLSNMAHSFENVCDIISNWASEGLKKSLAGVVYKHEKRNQGESVLVYLKMPKVGQIFKTAVVITFETIYFIILLWASEGLGKKNRKLFTSTIKPPYTE